jgi:hypothetical protein
LITLILPIDVLDNLVEHTSVAEDEDYQKLTIVTSKKTYFHEEDDFSSMLNSSMKARVVVESTIQTASNGAVF